jgi:hypothetical protein
MSIEETSPGTVLPASVSHTIRDRSTSGLSVAADVGAGLGLAYSGGRVAIGVTSLATSWGRVAGGLWPPGHSQCGSSVSPLPVAGPDVSRGRHSIRIYRLLGLVRCYGPAPIEAACARVSELDVVCVTKIAGMFEQASNAPRPL